MVAVPHCLEYVRLPEADLELMKVNSGGGNSAAPINGDKKEEIGEKKPLEILLVGDDMGICHMYKFTSQNWHYCTYNENQKNPNQCCKKQI